MPIKVLKASAGSGKTFRLTNDYIDLLSKSTHSQILAVTFTNKATEEMKSRIVKKLNKSAKNGDVNAKEYLNNILHDYSHFNVSTIDKFFQKVVRSMFRELGFSGLYTLILKNKELINEAVDEMLINLDQYENTYNFLLETALNDIKNEKDWSFSNHLKELSKLLWKEDFMNLKPEELVLYNNENAARFLNNCKEKKTEILEEWVSRAAEVNGELNKLDTSKYSKTIQGLIKKLDTFKVKELSNLSSSKIDKIFTPKQKEKLQSIIIGETDSIEAFFPSSDANKKYIATTNFSEVFKEFSISFINNLKILLSINAIISGAKYLPVILEIYTLIRNRLKDRNEFLLSEINHLLAGMIGGDDAPFIYEKLGSQIHNYLLDEFQDTSTMQWNNFIPLIDESVSSGKENLVVGDVKQSIYRWRNSDWTILGRGIKERYQQLCEDETLNDNWRSKKNIVEFNNILFERLVQNLNKSLSGDNTLKNTYDSLKQTINIKRENSDGGYVCTKFWKKVNDVDYITEELESLYNDINSTLEKGYELRDMGILVRGNKEAKIIVEFLLEKGINVVSSESLLISSSVYVKQLVLLLQMSAQGETSMINLLIDELYEGSVSLESHRNEISKAAKLPLFEQVERYIQILGFNEKHDAIVYIQAFQDLVFNYVQKKSSDINGFLAYWENEGCESSIESAEGVNAINVLTIHKAKGLDFLVLFLPMCDWTINPVVSTNWYKDSSDLFENKLPILPLKEVNALDYSIFDEQYKKEKQYKIIDNLNLLYVAFTRPRNAMYIYSVPDHEVYTWLTEAYVVFDTIDGYENNKCNNDDNIIMYSIGELMRKEDDLELKENKKDDKDEDDEKINAIECGYPSVDYNNENSNISLNFQTENFIQHKGNVLHGILQNIKTKSDANKAINKAIRMGLISTVEVPRINKDLEKIFNNPQTCSWYDGTYQKIWNERTIISDNNNYRPDRIMEKDGELLVVDYKFGQPKQEHLNQLSKYVELLQGMGKWTSVRGCLYYHKDQSLQCID